MKTNLENAITGQYVMTSMSIGWDSECPVADPAIFTTMSIEYTHDPVAASPANVVSPIVKGQR
jgi:hypothetical protein